MHLQSQPQSICFRCLTKTVVLREQFLLITENFTHWGHGWWVRPLPMLPPEGSSEHLPLARLRALVGDGVRSSHSSRTDHQGQAKTWPCGWQHNIFALVASLHYKFNPDLVQLHNHSALCREQVVAVLKPE